MARYFLNPDCTLDWLLKQDSRPDILPSFPADDAFGLVVAYLASGQVVSEVVPTPQQFNSVCGVGIPLGRLYFHISKNRLYTACQDLTPAVFNENSGA
jgi:hypothetical protein